MIKTLTRKFSASVSSILKKKTGFSVSWLNSSIKRKGLRFSGISLSGRGIQIEIEYVTVGIALNRKCFRLHLKNLKCYKVPSTGSSGKKDKKEQPVIQSPKRILSYLKLLLKGPYPKILRYLQLTGEDFQFYDKIASNTAIYFTTFNFREREIKLETGPTGLLRSKYRISLRLHPGKLLYTIRCISTVLSDQIRVSNSIGKIEINKDNQLTINASAGKIVLHNEKLAEGELTLNASKAVWIVDQFDDRIELNPESTIQVNTIKLKIKISYSYQDGVFSMMLLLSSRVESLIHAIPNLKLQALKDFSSEGEIDIMISLGFIWSAPLHYKFKLEYDFDDLKINSPGIDLSYLINEFEFYSSINATGRRLIKVAQSAIGTTDLPLIAKVVQLCEDPDFYKHNGVDSRSIGVAIANNMARKQFFKGASTLTMQLVKNLFLAEQKSVARKLEELIITLMMENYFNIPKARILEMYLQIIELGPNIYGIGEASKYYFNKTSTELTLLECLIISYIIPRPRFFLDALLAKSEQLNGNLCRHIESKATMLLLQRKITAEEFRSIEKTVNFHNIGELALKSLNIENLPNLSIINFNQETDENTRSEAPGLHHKP